MQELVKVAVDAMGGDNAPLEIVKGAVEALELRKDLKVILVGPEETVRAELKKYSYDEARVEVVNASEVIEMAEPPVQAIRTKKDSSIVVAMKLVKNGEAGLAHPRRKRRASQPRAPQNRRGCPTRRPRP